MIEIDGSFGEGGGQILRTSSALAALTGQAMRISAIRAGRPKPGLMRQHLAAVRAVAAICGGELQGDELHSQELVFSPGAIRGGNYRFAVGSAGNAVLIAQAVLPPLLHAGTPSHVRIEGGTHTANAPLFEFFQNVFLPCLREMGAKVTARLVRTGFYPAGGGVLELDVQPLEQAREFTRMDRGNIRAARIAALGHGIDRQILVDEIDLCREMADLPDAAGEIDDRDSAGPGNALYIEIESEHATELFGVCGDVTLSRRHVAKRAAGMAAHYRQEEVPVWRFLADQLLLPMALGAGGRFRTVPPTPHTQTNAAVIGRFLPEVGIEMKNLQNGQYIIEVKK